VQAAPFNARRSWAQIPETTRVTVVGEEVFIPLTQKNLTTGEANKRFIKMSRNMYPHAKTKRRK